MIYFVVEYEYQASPERLAEIRPRHRAFLDRGYARDWFLASGPADPPTSGILIARAPSAESLEALLAEDPFVLENVARASIRPFNPVKRHPLMAGFFEA